ncbi:MAG: hypothetical protein KBF85_12750 [Tabrizicola sp.]|jgi:hypothetical protein|nr:hypothetical protein [Tabrizicola sp.]
MEPDVTVTLGAGKPGRPRPSPLVRLTEAAGMAVILWGIGMGPLWLAGIGAGMVVGSYAAYRRKHGPLPPGRGGSDGIPDDGSGDGGGD